MNEITCNQLFKELDNSLKKSFNQFMAIKKNDIENLRNDFFKFGEINIDRILKDSGLERHQIDGMILNHMRMILTMKMIEIV